MRYGFQVKNFNVSFFLINISQTSLVGLDARFEKISPVWQCRCIFQIPVVFRKMYILLVTLATVSL